MRRFHWFLRDLDITDILQVELFCRQKRYDPAACKQSDIRNLVVGPTADSVFGIFGIGSFYDAMITVQDNSTDSSTVCKLLRLPFPGLNSDTPVEADDLSSCTSDSEQMLGIFAGELQSWLEDFSSTMNTNAIFTMATYASAQAMLNPDGYPDSDFQRPIHTSPGFQTEKLHVAPAAMVAISLLIAVQLSGLLCLAIYARSQPTWTETLDSFAVLRFGAAIAEDLPYISAADAHDVIALDEKEGWIGDEGGDGDLRKLSVGGPYIPMRHAEYCVVDGGRKLHMRGQLRVLPSAADSVELKGYQDLRGYQIYWRRLRRFMRKLKS